MYDAGEDEISAFGNDGIAIIGFFETNGTGCQCHDAALACIFRR
jgi:hypothetical protein